MRNDDIDDAVSFTDRIQFHWQKFKFWYDSLSDDVRMALHVLLGLLVLYVAFGGRFGFESGHRLQGNYGANNAYEVYRNRRTTTDNYYDSNNRSSRNADNIPPGGAADTTTTTTTNSETYANSWGYSRNPGAYSENGSSDGVLLYVALTAGALYLAHMLGLSPWQMMLLLNMAGGRRRQRFGGGMMYGGGFGGARPRMNYGRRW